MKTNLRLRLGCLLALFALGLPAAPRTLAAPSDHTFTVDTTADLTNPDTSTGVCPVGSCSLRAAIMVANVTIGSDVTIIVPSGTYTLTRPRDSADGADNGDLNLTTPASGNPVIAIVGAGAASTIIDANKIDRVLSVATSRTATISGVTIRNGVPQSFYDGGGVSNSGTLTITDSVIENNKTHSAGGGIVNRGTLNITRSTIFSNTAFLGGGLYTQSTVTIRDSTIYGNAADYNGGGYGGGIEVSSMVAALHLVIVNSTISQNYADNDGGGIDNEGNTYLYNTSVIDNDAYHNPGDPTGGTGGGVYVNASSTFQVVNTIIARNTINNAPIPDNCKGTLVGFGLNLLDEVVGCTFTGNGDASHGFISLNTIGPLQNNGGPTLTHALLPGSEAIDTTYAQGCIDGNGITLTTDQRGRPRPVGVACDVGAFEFGFLLYLPAVAR